MDYIGSHLRSDLHFTSGRRPPVRRRGCLSSLIIDRFDIPQKYIFVLVSLE